MSFHIDRLEARRATLPEVAYSFQHILYQNSNGMEDTEEINKSNMKYRIFIEV